MNKILQRIAAKYDVLNRNPDKINLLNEFINGKKLTIKGEQLKQLLLQNIITQAKNIAAAYIRNNKKITPTILKNHLSLSYLTYMTNDKILTQDITNYDSLDIINTDKQHIFDIICSQICKEYAEEIIPNYQPPQKKEKLKIEQEEKKEEKINITPNIETRLKFELQPNRFTRIHYPNCLDYENLTDYFIHYLKYDNKQKNNINQILQKLNSNKQVFNSLANTIYDIINNNIDNILPLIQFPKTKEAGHRLYEHSWQGFPDYQRDDAKTIFKAFGSNINLANEFLKLKNLSVQQIIKYLDLTSWSVFMNEVYISQHDEKLEWYVREYLRNLNEEIHQQHSDDILAQNIDIDKTTIIDYNPRYDNYRSGPIIVIRQFDNKGNYINDEAHEGIPGSNHLSVLKSLGYESNSKNTKFSHCFAKNDIKKENPIFLEAYRVGDIGFIYEDNLAYTNLLTPKEIAKVIQRDCGLEQIFILPPKPQGGIITRLAKKIKI